MGYRKKPFAIWRLPVVALAMIFVAAGLPNPARAADGDPLPGDRYENAKYGFAISWDSERWNGSEAVFASGFTGVRLDSLSIAFFVAGTPDRQSSAGVCLDHMIGVWEANEPGFAEAPATEALPSTGIDGIMDGLFTVTLGSKTGDQPGYAYFGCANIAGGSAQLQISMFALAAGYADELPKWNDLFSAIELTGPESGSQAPAHVPAPLQTYESEDGYAVRYDGSVWAFDTSGRSSDFSSETVQAFLTPIDAEGTLAACTASAADQWVDTDLVESSSPAPDALRRPEAATGAAGELFILKTSDHNQKFVLYAECRAIDAGSNLRIEMVVGYSDYADSLSQIQRLLNGISVQSSK